MATLNYDVLRVEAGGATGIAGILRNRQTGYENVGTYRQAHMRADGNVNYWTPDGYMYATGIAYSNAWYPTAGNVSEMLDALAVAVTGGIGITGGVGTQGATGLPGAAGTQGVTGLAGSAGGVGSQGVTGVQGIQGIQGNVGSQGVTGLIGFTGAQGETGTGVIQHAIDSVVFHTQGDISAWKIPVMNESGVLQDSSISYQNSGAQISVGDTGIVTSGLHVRGSYSYGLGPLVVDSKTDSAFVEIRTETGAANSQGIRMFSNGIAQSTIYATNSLKDLSLTTDGGTVQFHIDDAGHHVLTNTIGFTTVQTVDSGITGLPIEVIPESTRIEVPGRLSGMNFDITLMDGGDEPLDEGTIITVLFIGSAYNLTIHSHSNDVVVSKYSGAFFIRSAIGWCALVGAS